MLARHKTPGSKRKDLLLQKAVSQSFMFICFPSHRSDSNGLSHSGLHNRKGTLTFTTIVKWQQACFFQGETLPCPSRFLKRMQIQPWEMAQIESSELKSWYTQQEHAGTIRIYSWLLPSSLLCMTQSWPNEIFYLSMLLHQRLPLVNLRG